MGSNYVTLHRWKIIVVFTTFLYLISLLFLFNSIVKAADFDTEIDITYTVDPSGVMHIREIRKIQNNSQNFYIPENSTEQFIISTFKVLIIVPVSVAPIIHRNECSYGSQISD